MKTSSLACTGLVALVLAACGGGGAVEAPPAAVLSAPSVVVLTPSPGAPGATLSWQAVEGALGYRVFLAAAAGIPSTGPDGLPEARTATVPADETAFTFTGLHAGQRYYAAVCAIGNPSDSPLSVEAEAVLVPDRPTGLAVENGNGCVTLTWAETPGAETYDVFLATLPNVSAETWSTLPEGAALMDVHSPLTLCDLQMGASYFLVVRAVNDAGPGPESAGVGAIPRAYAKFVVGDPVGVGVHPVEVVAADIDGDGLTDLAVCDSEDGAITFHRGMGSGTPELAGVLEIDLPLPLPPDSEFHDAPEPPARHPLVFADFDGDGLLDLAVGLRPGQGARVYLGDGAFGFSESETFSPDADVRDLATADVDGDGTADLLVIDRMLPTLTVWLGDGDGTFTLLEQYPADIDPSRIAIGDLDGDGVLDAIVTDTGPGKILVFLGAGDGTLTATTSVGTAAGPEGVALGDVDADGALDLLVAATETNSVQCFLGHGDGTFSLGSSLSVGSNPRSLALSDFNGDGSLDLAVSNRGSGTVTVFGGVGNGSFLPVQTLELPDEELPGRIAVGDYDADGRLDLAVVGAWNHVIAILHGYE